MNKNLWTLAGFILSIIITVLSGVIYVSYQVGGIKEKVNNSISNLQKDIDRQAKKTSKLEGVNGEIRHIKLMINASNKNIDKTAKENAKKLDRANDKLDEINATVIAHSVKIEQMLKDLDKAIAEKK